MLDNLRRSLLAPATLLGFGLCWLLPLPAALVATLLMISTVAIPAFLPIVFSAIPRHFDISLRSHFARLAAELQTAAASASTNSSISSRVFVSVQHSSICC